MNNTSVRTGPDQLRADTAYRPDQMRADTSRSEANETSWEKSAQKPAETNQLDEELVDNAQAGTVQYRTIFKCRSAQEQKEQLNATSSDEQSSLNIRYMFKVSNGCRAFNEKSSKSKPAIALNDKGQGTALSELYNGYNFVFNG
ncbi:paired amphipathic helix protein Sin3-like 2-like [Dorcoceras hygrometricum]|uniref:Paired amphipathic helix protein Sin3-like 2-like n=1 Tax=Dorcoceras hygrometricum TaxID=472368 RepID=A0A2Z7AXZ6_9LAMI|nr:paired amphipathic helix protein Sin3-like 2-like [Dorcoceras hygrometricum]